MLAMIWGFSFLLIKLSTEAFAPPQLSLLRILSGAAVLLAVLLLRRDRLPRGRTWLHLAVAAFFLNVLPFTLFGYAELRISSTLASICNATTPLWAMVVAMVALQEDRPTRARLGGLLIGFIGVLTVLNAWQGFAGHDLAGTAMALVGSACYPIGWVYVRRTLADRSGSHLSLSTGQLLIGTAQLAVITPLVSGLPTAFPTGPFLAVITLGVAGTAVALLLQYRLVAEVGPTIGQMVTYFIPLVATVAGVTLLGEELTWTTPVGAVIVLIGAALTQSKRRTGVRQPPRAEPATAETR